jgi:hypothetical protein
MKRRYAVILGVALGLVGSLLGFATIGRTATEPQRYGPPIGPVMQKDTGPGEVLLAVVGGVFETEVEAVAANEAMAFGDVAGYYVVPVDQFEGFREQLAKAGDYALVSVFRTDEGAREFADVATAFGYPATVLSQRVKSFGGEYAGLGQEKNPDGTGPLLGPIPESLGLEEPEP